MVGVQGISFIDEKPLLLPRLGYGDKMEWWVSKGVQGMKLLGFGFELTKHLLKVFSHFH